MIFCFRSLASTAGHHLTHLQGHIQKALKTLQNLKIALKCLKRSLKNELLKVCIEINGWQIKIKEVCESVAPQFYSSIMLNINWDGA